MGIPSKFGNPDDYSHMSFKYYSTSLVTAHINIQVIWDSFLILES